jgi:hypothetical protein
MTVYTPVYGWPFQALGDPPDGPNLGEDLALAIEATMQQVAALSNQAAISVQALQNKPFCELQTAAVQALTGSAFTNLNLTTVIEDTNGMADVANNRIIIKTDGFYRILGQCTYATGVAHRGVFLVKNGLYIASTTVPSSAADNNRQQASRVIRCVVGDLLSMQAFTTVAVNTEGNTTYGGVFLSAEWIRPLP